MSRLLKEMFGITEMPRRMGDPMKQTLQWASEQPGTFTMKDLYRVYTANGGRANSEGENDKSFTSQMMHHIARFWKDPPKNQVSDQRPIVAVKQGSRGGGGRNPHIFRWGLDKQYQSDASRFVNPADDNTSGDAMDRLEKVLSRQGKGLPADEKAGRAKLKAAIERWKQMPNINQVVADIRASIPKAGQMDALHIATEFLMDRGVVDQDDVEDAEDDVAPAPSSPKTPSHPDDDDDFGGSFDDEPMSDTPFDELPDEDYTDITEPDEEEPEEEEPPPAPPQPQSNAGVTVRKGAAPPAPPPPRAPSAFDDEEEPETKQQAGAQNFIKPTASSAPAKKSSVGALMKKFKK